MVAVFNKELLSWYLITLKLNETMQAQLPRLSAGPSTPQRPLESPPPLLPLTQGEPSVTSPPPVAAAPSPAPAVDEWVISIRVKLEQARQHETVSPWTRFCIYRIPNYLVREDGDEKAYVPQMVSIGPYHHGKKRLRNVENHKWRALHHVLRRTGHSIGVYLDAVRSVEERARACYEGQIGLNTNEFVEMMVLDGTFVLELFRGVAGEGFKELGYSHGDPVFAMRGTMHSVQRDMIMLENQIPLFVLDMLFGRQINQPGQSGLVARLAVRFFDPLMPTDEPLRKADRTMIERSVLSEPAAFDPFAEAGLHCLDVFRRSLLRTGPKPESRLWLRRRSDTHRFADKRRQQLVHCVTELKEAGVKFRKRKTDRFWDVEFKDGVLRIPRLLIHDGTKSLFMNLMALEQCHMELTNEITSYVIFMDNLINSEEDVAYLHYRGIIEHWLGNDAEVADLFNKLCQEVVFDMNNSYLSVISGRLNRYYNQRWNTWRASLKHRYFSNPWAVLSLVAAVLLLLLTMGQTYMAFYAYYHSAPSSSSSS